MERMFLSADPEQYRLTLVEELDKRFPQRTPQPDQTLAEIMFQAGQRSVVDYLRSNPL